MKTSVLLLCLLAAGCSLTPTQKKYTAIGLGVLAVGLIAAHDSSDDKKAIPPVGPPPGCTPQPDGSCR